MSHPRYSLGISKAAFNQAEEEEETPVTQISGPPLFWEEAKSATAEERKNLHSKPSLVTLLWAPGAGFPSILCSLGFSSSLCGGQRLTLSVFLDYLFFFLNWSRVSCSTCAQLPPLSVYACEVNAVSAESSSQHLHRHFWPLLGRVWASGLLRCSYSKPLQQFPRLLPQTTDCTWILCGPRMSLSLVPPAICSCEKILGKQLYVQRQRTGLELQWLWSPWTVAVWGTTPQFILDDL